MIARLQTNREMLTVRGSVLLLVLASRRHRRVDKTAPRLPPEVLSLMYEEFLAPLFQVPVTAVAALQDPGAAQIWANV